MRPLRDRATLVCYGQMFWWVWVLDCFGATQASVRDELGLGTQTGSLFLAMLALGGVASGLAFAPLARVMSRGAALRLGSALLMAGAAVYALGGSLAATLAGIATASFGGGIGITGANSFISEHQRGAAPASLSEGNALAAVAGLLSPLAVGAAIGLSWGWQAGFLVAVAGVVALEAWRGLRLGTYATTAQSRRSDASRPALPRLFWWCAGLLVCTSGIEMGMAFWTVDLLRDRAGMEPAAAAASLGLLIGGMAIGRVVGSRLTLVTDPERVLAAGLAVCILAFAGVWATSSALPMLAGLVVCGIGMGVHYPLGMARALRASDGSVNRGSGWAGALIGVGIATSAGLLGVLSAAVGIHGAFLVVPALALIALAILLARPVAADRGEPAVSGGAAGVELVGEQHREPRDDAPRR